MNMETFSYLVGFANVIFLLGMMLYVALGDPGGPRKPR
jgi:hypothetical protein